MTSDAERPYTVVGLGTVVLTWALLIVQLLRKMHASFAAVFVLLEFVSKSSHGQTGLSEVDKQKLLDVHNYFRSVVYPRASNMERMVSWSMCSSTHTLSHLY